MQSYGYKHTLTLYNLDKLGLLTAQTSTRNYAVLRKRLKLTMDDVNEINPNDIGTRINKFFMEWNLFRVLRLRSQRVRAPQREASPEFHLARMEVNRHLFDIRVKIGQFSHSVWRSIRDVLELLPGATVEEEQKIDVPGNS